MKQESKYSTFTELILKLELLPSSTTTAVCCLVLFYFTECIYFLRLCLQVVYTSMDVKVSEYGYRLFVISLTIRYA